MRRRTTTRDIARLRALAAAGLSMRAAARECGMVGETVRRYEHSLGLGFTGGNPVAAAQAAARLAATMSRVRATPAEWPAPEDMWP